MASPKLWQQNGPPNLWRDFLLQTVEKAVASLNLLMNQAAASDGVAALCLRWRAMAGNQTPPNKLLQ
jgi:hypothetical protein